jgi:hypothetical protein
MIENRIVYLKGEYVPWENANVHIMSHSFGPCTRRLPARLFSGLKRISTACSNLLNFWIWSCLFLKMLYVMPLSRP